jgi:hypothetical protein
VTIVKTKLAEIHDELAGQFDKVALKGQGPSSFLYAINQGRAVEIPKTTAASGSNFGKRATTEMRDR